MRHLHFVPAETLNRVGSNGYDILTDGTDLVLGHVEQAPCESWVAMADRRILLWVDPTDGQGWLARFETRQDAADTLMDVLDHLTTDFRLGDALPEIPPVVADAEAIARAAFADAEKESGE